MLKRKFGFHGRFGLAPMEKGHLPRMHMSGLREFSLIGLKFTSQLDEGTKDPFTFQPLLRKMVLPTQTRAPCKLVGPPMQF